MTKAPRGCIKRQPSRIINRSRPRKNSLPPAPRGTATRPGDCPSAPGRHRWAATTVCPTALDPQAHRIGLHHGRILVFPTSRFPTRTADPPEPRWLAVTRPAEPAKVGTVLRIPRKKHFCRVRRRCSNLHFPHGFELEAPSPISAKYAGDGQDRALIDQGPPDDLHPHGSQPVDAVALQAMPPTSRNPRAALGLRSAVRPGPPAIRPCNIRVEMIM
jgi:hypothetical protein